MPHSLDVFRNLKAWLVSGLFVLSVLAVSAPGYAQSARDINNRLDRLENELQTLNRAVYKGETPPQGAGFSGDPASQAAAEVRLQQLEIEIRTLTGKVEEQSYEVRQMKEQIERMRSDMELRLSDLEGGPRPAASGEPSPASRYTTGGLKYQERLPPGGNTSGGYQWNSGTGAAGEDGQLGTLRQPADSDYNNVDTASGTTAADTGASAYENAFALLKNAQYDRAETEFAAFLQRYPTHALAGNAKYWLGETYYVRNDFETAARIFAEAYQQYPDNTKAPDNLLKLGMSLSALGNNNDACIALGQLQTQYPNGAGPVLRRAKQEIQRLGCS